MNFINNISAGDITYRLTEDADRVSEVIYKTFQDTLPCLLQLLAVIFYMFYLDWSLTISTFVLAPIIILSVNNFGERVLKASEKSQNKISSLAGLLSEAIQGLPMVKAFAVEEWLQKDFEKQVEVMHKKKNSMREALAKMWGIDEGKNPFDKKENKKYNKKEGKTLTGKPETKIEVEPKMEKKK